VGNGSVCIAGNQIILDTATDTGHATHSSEHQSTSFSGWQIDARRGSNSDGSTDTATQAGSTIQGSRGVSIAAQGLVSASAANLDAGAGALQIKGAAVDLASAQNVTRTYQQGASSKGGMDTWSDLTLGQGSLDLTEKSATRDDHAAAQADFAVVQHGRLARRHGPLRRVELQ
jgi:hypothetical protein